MNPAKKKPELAVLIGMAGKGKKAAEEPADEGESAEEDAMAAFEEARAAKDWGRAVEAFRTLSNLCHSEESAEGEE